MTAGGVVVLRQIHYGKYAGRVVARVYSRDDKDFSKALLQAGLGRAPGCSPFNALLCD